MNVAERRLMEKYRAVLFSPLGIDVLSDILVNLCGFGGYINVEGGKDIKEEVGAYNVGISILGRLGVCTKETPPSRVIMALSGVMPEIPEEAKEEE